MGAWSRVKREATLRLIAQPLRPYGLVGRVEFLVKSLSSRSRKGL
jgi:hypothetical protein